VQLPVFAAMSRANAAQTSCTVLWWTRWKVACTVHRTSPRRCSIGSPVFCRSVNDRRHLPTLTSRESEILALVEQGRSNKDIARQLAIGSATVENHMHNILQKLQVTRRGEAAARLHVHPGI
jgi:DNA-binding NarL/FixJ family response regulator